MLLFRHLKQICVLIFMLHSYETSSCPYVSKYDKDKPMRDFKNIHSSVFVDKQPDRSHNVSNRYELVRYYKYQLSCGTMVYDPTSAIFDGRSVPEKAWPWQIKMHSTKNICGGVLIDTVWALTAAHCVERKDVEFNIILGTIFKRPTNNFESRRVKVVIPHEEYNSRYLFNDIALLKLDSPVTFTDKIRPACLPIDLQDFSMNDRCYMTGFGVGRSGQQDILQQLSVNVVPDRECAYLWKLNYKNNDWRNICAGRVRRKGGVSDGDSGGPLSCQIGNKYYVAGVASANPGNLTDFIVPDDFTKVSEFIDWIFYNIVKFRDS